MTVQPAGPILDAAGVTLDLYETQRLAEVMVIGKAIDMETGQPSILIGASEGLDWIAQLGLIYAARSVCDGGMEEDE